MPKAVIFDIDGTLVDSVDLPAAAWVETFRHFGVQVARDAALRRIEPVAAGETVVVGDSPLDAQAAGKLGLSTVGLPCGGFPEDDLRDAGRVAVYRNPEDLHRHERCSALGR